jgi:hypothetical protein
MKVAYTLSGFNGARQFHRYDTEGALGRIGRCNVVLACFPSGTAGIGTAIAARCSLRSFPSRRGSPKQVTTKDDSCQRVYIYIDMFWYRCYRRGEQIQVTGDVIKAAASNEDVHFIITYSLLRSINMGIDGEVPSVRVTS